MAISAPPSTAPAPAGQKPFRVIISGGSICGLTLALALEKAGIDYVLLEKREIAPQLGASIGFAAHGVRVQEQLGIWDDVEASINRLEEWAHFAADGSLVERSQVLDEIRKVTRRPNSLMSRRTWLTILHSHIQDRSKLHDHNGVASYRETDDGIVVTSEKGDRFEGSILVGADGIHSKVRSLMADETEKEDPKMAKRLREGFVAEYNCVYVTSKNERKDQPGKPIMPEATISDVYCVDHSGIVAAGMPGQLFWFFYQKMPQSARTPNVPRYTDADAEEAMNKYGHVHMGPDYTVKDLWDARTSSNMAALEEGVIKAPWSRGRVLLMGDAVHKCTINPGLGGQLTLEGICQFTNGLVPLLRASPCPTGPQLATLFADFEARQRPRAGLIVSVSGFQTRLEAQATWYIRLLWKWLMPYVSDSLKANTMIKWVYSSAPCFDWLPPRHGIVAPPQELPEEAARTSKAAAVVSVSQVPAAA